MKRIISTILVIFMILGTFSGCSNGDDGAQTDSPTDETPALEETTAPSEEATDSSEDTDDEKISVVTTIFPQYDIVRQIAGDNVELTMLLSPGAESHSYEPTPQDIITIQQCDVFIYVGGESDVWVDSILESMDTENMEIISLMDLVDVVEEEVVEGMQVEEEHEEEEGEEEVEYDEHVWTSPKNAQIMVSAIAQTLAEKDTVNADSYLAAAQDYNQELEALDAAFQEVVTNAERTTIVFGDRFPFRYFADEYGLEYYAAFVGCSTETEASASTIAFLIDKVNDEEIPVVFHIELSNEKIADTICESTGATKLLLHSCHNVTKDDFEAGITYLDLMQQNVEALRTALS